MQFNLESMSNRSQSFSMSFKNMRIRSNNNGTVFVAYDNIMMLCKGSSASGGNLQFFNNRVQTSKITVDDYPLTDNDERIIIKVSNENGLVTVVENGQVSIYRGQKFDLQDRKVIIDGIEVTKDDSRLVNKQAELCESDRVNSNNPI